MGRTLIWNFLVWFSLFLAYTLSVFLIFNVLLVMFKNYKTSTIISLKFTFLSVVIVILFGSIVNLLFFHRRYNKLEIAPVMQWSSWLHLWGRFKKKIFIEKDSSEYQLLKMGTLFRNIYAIKGEYFFLKEIENKVMVQDITSEIKWQLWLLYTTLRLILFFGILSYLISRFFVKNALKKLNILIHHIKKSDLDNLSPIAVAWNNEDEINIVAVKINEFLARINYQSGALKDFVANVSHELRTPMMSISSDIDYALKSKEYVPWLEKIKERIKEIDALITQFLLLTKIDSQEKLLTHQENIAPLIEKIVIDLEKKYQHKKIITKVTLLDSVQNLNKNGFEVIIKNLVENAFKYTNEGSITISNTQESFIITDTGIGIKKADQYKLWEKFWQVDRSRTEDEGFGLGLYLIKLLVEKHGWTIELNSKEDKGTTFTIYF